MLTYKDICEEDRFFIILSIRDLTFPEPENKLMLKGEDSSGVSFDVELSTKYFTTENIPEEISQSHIKKETVS